MDMGDCMNTTNNLRGNVQSVQQFFCHKCGKTAFQRPRIHQGVIPGMSMGSPDYPEAGML